MKMITTSFCFIALCLTGGFGSADTVPPGFPAGEVTVDELDGLAGTSVDISPWTYSWRSDFAVQKQPEACFIPRRLERIDTVYRTAIDVLPEDELKSIHYNQPDILKRLPPKPAAPLQAGLLWTGGIVDCRVELIWPVDAAAIPAPENVEVRVYPTAWGWFGWTVDRILSAPEVSADGRSWTYKIEPGLKMDYAYNRQVDAATEMVAVFYEGAPEGIKTVIPNIRVYGSNVGAWKRMDVEIEWGFQEGRVSLAFDGRLETQVAVAGPLKALPGDTGTTVTARSQWKSEGIEKDRRGIVVPVLYAPDNCPGLDSRITLWTNEGGGYVPDQRSGRGFDMDPGSRCFRYPGRQRADRQAVCKRSGGEASETYPSDDERTGRDGLVGRGYERGADMDLSGGNGLAVLSRSGRSCHGGEAARSRMDERLAGGLQSVKRQTSVGRAGV